jgi:hypothetical protein
MVAMGIFPFKEKSPWQNLESNPGPQDQQSETLTTRPRGWSVSCEVEINTFLSYRLKLDVIRSSVLKSFLLGLATVLHGNASPSLGCPIHIGSNKLSYNLLSGKSGLPQLSCRHICPTAVLRNIQGDQKVSVRR